MNTLVFVTFVASVASASVVLGPAAPLGLGLVRSVIPQTTLISPGSSAIISSAPASAQIISGGILPGLLASPAISSRTVVEGPSGIISTADNSGIIASNRILASSIQGWPLGRSLWL